MDSLNREKLIEFIPMLTGFRDEDKAARLRTDDEYYHQVEKSLIVPLESRLSPRERKIALMHFGLEDGRTRTLAEVGQAFGITEEEARVYEATILRKLRHPRAKEEFYKVY